MGLPPLFDKTVGEPVFIISREVFYTTLKLFQGVSQNHQIRCSSGTLVLYYEKIWILSFCFRNFLDFGHTLIKLLFFLAFMLFLLLEKDDSQYAHFGFLHAVY